MSRTPADRRRPGGVFTEEIAVSVKAVAVALAACVALSPAAAHAAEGRWTSGYNMGQTSANVGNGRATLIATCVDDGVRTATSGLILEVPGLRGGENRRAGGTISIDGRDMVVQFERRVLDQGQVSLSWHAPASDRVLTDAWAVMLNRLRAGRSVTVRLPSQNIRETFTLTGARDALRDCPGR